MKRGRPSKSEIRDRITVLLERLGFSYGYEIYKYYRQLFDNATSRIIYYHLRKGVDTGEFVIVNVKRVPGNFTWGSESERVYYALGPFYSSNKSLWDKTLSIDVPKRSIDYDWGVVINDLLTNLKNAVKNSDGSDRLKLLSKCDKLLSWAKSKLSNYSAVEREINSIKLFLK